MGFRGGGQQGLTEHSSETEAAAAARDPVNRALGSAVYIFASSCFLGGAGASGTFGERRTRSQETAG